MAAITAMQTFEVSLRAGCGTVLIEPLGELDIASVSRLADAFESLADHPHRADRVVLDLRGLTFMDATGIHELIRRDNEAPGNRYDLAVIRGGASIDRLISLTAIDKRLAFVESPEDLSPPLPLALLGSASDDVAPPGLVSQRNARAATPLN